METYTYHLAVYSKLIQGHSPGGPIMKGAESRVNGRSAGFPSLLIPHCRTSSFFKNDPSITEIDPRLINGGVFVYRPSYLGGKHYSIFGRIEARSEGGVGKPGRRYTHCAMIFVEDKWEPELIPWAAEMLFSERRGGRCWGEPATERDEARAGWDVPVLDRDDMNYDVTERLLDLSCDSSGRYLCRGNLPRWTREDQSPYPILAREVADFLRERNLGTHGRWLNFGFGIGPTVEPQSSQFFLRFDAREGDVRNHQPVALNFDDNSPPVVWGNFAAQEAEKQLPLIDWASLSPQRDGAIIRESVLSDANLWPDQAEDEVEEGGVLISQDDASALARSAFDAIGSGAAGGQLRNIENAIPIPRFLDKRGAGETAPIVTGDWLDQRVLPETEAAFHQMIGQAALLDPEFDFVEYNAPIDQQRMIAAFEKLFMFVFTYAAVDNINKLREPLDMILAHQAIPNLMIEAGPRPGILQDLFCRMIDNVGIERINDFIDDRARVETSLKIPKVRAGEIDSGYMVYPPQARNLYDFVAWLKEGALEKLELGGSTADERALKSCYACWHAWTDEASARVGALLQRAHD